MPTCISLVNNQGRLFVNLPVKPETDGLIAIIDFKQKNKTYIPSYVKFSSTGESVLIADSRHQVTQLQLANNRFNVIADNLKETPCLVTYTGKYPQDCVFTCLNNQKQLVISALNGKAIERIQMSNHHQREIKVTDINVRMALMLTLSADACVLWSTNQNNSIVKSRSLYAQAGCVFVDAKFASEGSKVATLFKDGQFVLWSLEGDQAQSLKFQFKGSSVTLMDLSPSLVIGSGHSCPFLVVKELQHNQQNVNGTMTQEGLDHASQNFFRLPNNARGIEQLQFLRDKTQIAYLSEGYFYVVGLSNVRESSKLKILLELRVPGHTIKSFDVDANMNNLIFATTSGNAFIYNLPTAMENERILRQKKSQMGCDDNTINTYLERVDENTYMIDANNNSIIQNNTAQPHQLESFMVSEQTQKNATGIVPTGYTRQMSPLRGTFDNSNAHNMSNAAFNTSVKNPFQTNNYYVPESTLSQRKTAIQQTQQNRSTFQAPPPLQQQQSQTPIVQTSLQHPHQMSMDERGNQTLILPTTTLDKTTQHLYTGLPTAVANQSVNKRPIAQTQKSQNSSKSHTIDSNYKPDYKVSGSSTFQNQSMTAMFNTGKLKNMLNQYGEFPEKYRNLTWKFLLQLPLNKESFQALVDRGVHPVFQDLHKKFPVDSYRLYNKLVRLLSALGHWCPLFQQVEYLPQIVFPFIKMIPSDDLFVFELVMSLICQWMQVWFEGYPAAPITVLNAVDEIIGKEDPRLLQHLKDNSFAPQTYAWPLLSSFFTEVLSKNDWLKLMDYLFLNNEDPELLIYFCASFLICSRSQILQVACIEEMHCFLERFTTVPFKKMIQMALKMHKAHKTQILTGNFGHCLPISQTNQDNQNAPVDSGYPVFVRYPDQFVTYQSKIRSKIIDEEREIRQKEVLLADLKTQAEQILIQEHNTRLQQEAAAEAEAERKRNLQTEQELILQERIRLDEMTRLQRLDHIKQIEDAIANSLAQQERLKAEEDRIMNEEIQAKQRTLKYEYEARVQDEMIANIEFKANQKLMEQLQNRQQEEHIRKTKAEIAALEREEEHKQRVQEEKWRLEDKEQRLKNELARQQFQMQQRTATNEAERLEYEQKLQLMRHQKEIQQMHLEQQRKMRQMEEENIQKKQQLLDQMKVQSIQDKYHAEQKELKDRLEMERQTLMQENQERMQKIENDKKYLQEVLQKERDEKARLDQIERQQKIDKELHEQRLKFQHEQEEMRKQEAKIAYDKAQAEARHKELQKMSQDADQRNQLMGMLRQTESTINQICTDGQEKLDNDRLQRVHDSNKNLSDLEKDTWKQSRQQLEQHLSNAESFQKTIEERERQVREYNANLKEQLAQQQQSNRNFTEAKNQQEFLQPATTTGQVNQSSLSNSQSMQRSQPATISSNYGANNLPLRMPQNQNNQSQSYQLHDTSNEFTSESEATTSYVETSMTRSQMTNPAAINNTSPLRQSQQQIQTNPATAAFNYNPPPIDIQANQVHLQPQFYNNQNQQVPAAVQQQNQDYEVPLNDLNNNNNNNNYQSLRQLQQSSRQNLQGPVMEESSFLTSTVSSNLNDVSQSDATSMLSSTLSNHQTRQQQQMQMYHQNGYTQGPPANQKAEQRYMQGTSMQESQEDSSQIYHGGNSIHNGNQGNTSQSMVSETSYCATSDQNQSSMQQHQQQQKVNPMSYVYSR